MGKKENESAVKELTLIEVGFEGVEFTLPYAEKELSVRLSDQELDTLLSVSSQGLFRNVRDIELPEAHLPLLAMVQEEDVVRDDASAGWDVEMDVKIVSSSTIHSCAGRLAVVGVKHGDGHCWSKVLYETLPPLTHALVRDTSIVPIS